MSLYDNDGPQNTEALPYKDRAEAGRILAEALAAYSARDSGNGHDLYVLALPRGGVPVAAKVSEKLGAGLDLILVRKLGLPGHEEFAMGAIASGNTQVMNEDVLAYRNISPEAIDQVVARERTELNRREEVYRGSRPFPDLAGRRVILVDDGLATGATMRAAVEVVRAQLPRQLIVAVPVAPASTLQALRADVDDVVCPATPEPFLAIGRWYRDFGQTSDEEVQDLLAKAWQEEQQSQKESH